MTITVLVENTALIVSVLITFVHKTIILYILNMLMKALSHPHHGNILCAISQATGRVPRGFFTSNLLV